MMDSPSLPWDWAAGSVSHRSCCPALCLQADRHQGLTSLTRGFRDLREDLSLAGDHKLL